MLTYLAQEEHLGISLLHFRFPALQDTHAFSARVTDSALMGLSIVRLLGHTLAELQLCFWGN